MANIADSTFGSELKSAQDYLFLAEATPQNTSVVSGAKLLGRTQDALEIVVEVTSAITLGAGTELTVTYAYDDVEAGAYSDTIQVITVAGATTLPVGELARFVPSREWGAFAKITVATTDASADGAFSVYPVQVK